MLRKRVTIPSRISRVMLTEDFSITTIPDSELEEKLRQEAEDRRLEEQRQQELEAAVEEGIRKALEEKDSSFREQLEAARTEAFEKGHTAGYEEGEVQGAETLNPLRNRFMQMLVTVGKEKEQLYVEAHELILKMIFQISEKLLHRQVESDKDIIAEIVREALSFVADTTKVTIRLHPQDLKEAERGVAVELSQQGMALGVKFQADEMLQLGDCVVETNAGEVDARLSTKLAELEQLLLKKD